MKKLALIFNIIVGFLVSASAISQTMQVEVIGMTVKDMDRSLKFFTEVLGFQKISDKEYQGRDIENLNGLFGINIRVAQLRLGQEILELTDYLTAGGRSIPEDAKSNDLFFQHIAIVVSDMDKAYKQLKKYKVEHVSASPQTLPAFIPEAAGIRAFYFHDPDGHNLELIYFPPGKGQEKWQRNSGKLFLGIDHTAIAVSNTEASHQFYSGLLGLARKGDSRNHGMEQEHLNNIECASLHITGYRAPQGPGIEFLQYLQPGAGKPYPPDSHSNDIWHWQTTLVVDDAATLYNKLKKLNVVFVSKELVQSQLIDSTTTKSFIIRDPDGHAITVKQYSIDLH